MHRLHRVVAIALGLLLTAGTLQSQEVVGVLLEEDGTTPARGVLVEARHAVTMIRIATALTGQNGEFRIHVGRDSVRLRALRVGLRPVVLLESRGEGGAVRSLRFTLPREAIELPARSAVAATNCEAQSAQSARLASTLFEQALSALLLTVPGDSTLTVRVRTRRRAWTADERQLLADKSVDSIVSAPAGPETRPAERLFRDGFQVTAMDRSLLYLAPSAEFFASERFLQDYCLFDAGTRNDNRDLIGVGFHPARRRSGVARISGTFWLHRETLALDRLAFGYEGLPPEAMQGRPSGSIDFAPAADGRWAAVAWEVRMPQLRTTTTMRRSDRRVEVVRELSGITVISGELVDSRNQSPPP
jgi:hypothetical protein